MSKVGVWEEVKALAAFSISPRMRVLLPVCAWSGISIAFYSGVLVSILSHQQHGDHHSQYKESMFAMVALGIGQISGSFYAGFIVDKCGSRIAS